MKHSATGNALFTIVVPTYNRAHSLGRCLDSVLTQSLRPLELIVVDNASTDETPRLLTDWKARHEAPDLRVTLLREERRGAAAARKCGETHVRTPYVYFLDSDDALRPEAMALFAAAFKREPEAAIVCADVCFHSGTGKKKVLSKRPGTLIINHFHHCLLRTQAWAVSTRYLRECGGWDASLRIWDDWELGLRLLLRDPKVVWLKKVVADIYWQSDSVTGNQYSHRTGAYDAPLQAAHEAIAASGHTDSLLLMRLLHSRRMMLAALFAREGRADLATPLRARVLDDTARDPWLRLLLRAAYHYRAAGLPGADSLITPLL